MYKIEEKYHPVIELALETGELQRRFFRREGLQITTKSSLVDMVTEADIACDQLIVGRIKELFPEDAILSEEQGVQPIEESRSSGYEWIIDPLDGTTNFSIGHPIFAVSIARWRDGEPEFGVIYVPMLNELYYAQKGLGSFNGDNPLSISNRTKLEESVLATGFPYDRATAINNNSKNIEKMIPLIKGIRRMGAAAYDLCLVASGIYDAYWELRLGKWDMAAGCLMITEAGGEFRMTVDGGKYNVITGPTELCDKIATLVNMSNEIK